MSPPDHRPLADRQADLVAALVAGAPTPPGFDESRVRVARAALLNKRAREVAHAWPLLRAGLAQQWPATFQAWAAGRPPQGGLRDGWDFARSVPDDALDRLAARELAEREAWWRYDGMSAPRRRRWPAVRLTREAVVIQVLGRIRVYGRPVRRR